jgi:hypothetical protein
MIFSFADMQLGGKEVVVPEFQKRFTISYDELGAEGSSISFLKRRILKTEGSCADCWNEC